MVDINEIKDRIGKSLIKHMPEILTGAAVVGAIATPILVYKTKAKVDDILDTVEYTVDYANAKSKVDETKVYIRYTWRTWTPAIACGIITVGAIIGSHVSSAKQKAVVMAAYGATSTAFAEYRKHAEDIIKDPKKIKDINTKVAEATMATNPSTDVNTTGSKKSDEDTLFYDYMSGRYFWSTRNTIDAAVNKVNYEVNDEMACSLNTFYYYIGLDPIGMGEDFGWITDKLLSVSYGSRLTEDTKSAVVLQMDTSPCKI